MSGPWGHRVDFVGTHYGPSIEVSQQHYHRPGNNFRKAWAILRGLRKGGEDRCPCGGMLVAVGREDDLVRHYCTTCMHRRYLRR